MINKLDKLCKSYPKNFKLTREIILDGKVEGKEYSFDKKLVSIRQPSSRKLTEEQKQQAAERMKKVVKNKKK